MIASGRASPAFVATCCALMAMVALSIHAILPGVGALDMCSRDVCMAALAETGIVFTPGSVMQIEGYVRIRLATAVPVLRKGLSRVSQFLAQRAVNA